MEELMPDRETAQIVSALGKDSVEHADTVSKVMAALGEPSAAPKLEALPDPLDLTSFFRRQLEFERLALWLHNKAAELVPEELASGFRRIGQREEDHITMTERILSRLEGPGN